MVAAMSQPTDDRRPEESVRGGEIYETEIGDRRASEAVIDVISAIQDVEPARLTPLYRTVDPDALDSLCANEGLGAQPTVRFDYEGLIVTVSASGTLTVVEP